jgi:SOS regulatory protein LexA
LICQQWPEYNDAVHELQQKLLKLAQDNNLGQYTLREIGAMLGEGSAQKIKHHLNQLEKRGLIRIDRAKGIIEKTQQGRVKGLLRGARLLAIPILGSTNAGPARVLAEANIEGYLKVSSTLLGRRSNHRLFALRVVGPSMNRAEVDGKRIEDGDYVVVDCESTSPRNGDIVLSIIDGMANIKRFYRDNQHDQIALVSDSTGAFPPICIHADDDYQINGKVVQVIKKPKSR